MIEAVVIDMGGVLVSEVEGRKQLLEYDHLLGLPSGTLLQQLFAGEHWLAVSTGAIDLDTYWREVAGPYESQLPDHFSGYKDNFFRAPIDHAMVTLVQRLRPFYRLALLSNATVLLPDLVQREPLFQDLFDIVIVSALEGLRKPDPAIYELTCQRLTLAPEACLFIDDKARNTDAAQQLGMHTITHQSATDTERRMRAMGIKISD